jgi:EXPERA (EXPanded EBP superfamily)
MSRHAIPLRERPFDLLIIAFFVINLLFVTYIVDIEQLIIVDPYHFSYPLWPPAPAVDAIHWWGNTFDPLLMARPVWWKMTIWIDNLAFGPFYIVAIYAWARARDWIRLPSLLFSAVMLTNVTIILGEEFAGPHASPHFPIVLLANLAWLLVPLAIIVRMWPSPTPFTRDTKPESPPVPLAKGSTTPL